MDNKYIITSSGSFANADELYHWGIRGMKWGVRRYQNPDGSLTAAGRKRYTNSDGSLNEKGKKKFGGKMPGKSSDTETASAPKRNPVSDMDDNELQRRVNRLRNEDAYNDLSKKLGYDGPKTEIDRKIADMEKQKRYLELQRDINNLTPKKENKVKKALDTMFKKVIEPAATEAGKKFLSQYLSDAAAQALKKEADKTAKSVEKSAQKVKEKQAKQEAKQQAKQESKQKAKEERRTERSSGRSDDSSKYSVEGVGTSSRKTQTSKPKNNTVVDADPWPMLDSPVTSVSARKRNRGSSYVTNYSSTPVSRLPSPSSNIAGYLPAPKDDD